MGIIQAAKNSLGDKLRYKRCPVTRDSYFGLADRNWLTIAANYVVISKRALKAREWRRDTVVIADYVVISKRALKAREWTRDTVLNMAEQIYIRAKNIKTKTEVELRSKLDRARGDIVDIIENLNSYRKFFFPKLTT